MHFHSCDYQKMTSVRSGLTCEIHLPYIEIWKLNQDEKYPVTSLQLYANWGILQKLYRPSILPLDIYEWLTYFSYIIF
jgi:hypothetical protein